MRRALVVFACLASQAVAPPPPNPCPGEWLWYQDTDGSEGGDSCLFVSSGAKVKHSSAWTACHGINMPDKSHLLSFSSGAAYNQAGLLSFALGQSGDCNAATAGDCPVFWTAAKKQRIGNGLQYNSLQWQWLDKRTPKANLATESNVWGYYNGTDAPS